MTESEILFEKILENKSIKFGRIPTSDIPGKRTPDYIVDVDGVATYWEVKELCPNENEQQIAKNIANGINELYSVDSTRVRNRIESACGQFKKYEVTKSPCVVVLHDARPFETKDFLLYPTVLEAMLGRPQLKSSKDGQLTEISRSGALFTQKNKKYINALVVIHHHQENAVFLHNPNANFSLLESVLKNVFPHHMVAQFNKGGLAWEKV